MDYSADARSEHRPSLAARNEQWGNTRYQKLAIRKARTASASASARQTSFAGVWPGLPAGKDPLLLTAAEAELDLCIVTPLPSGGNNKGPGITGAFDARL